jgi:hypothetical protein
VGQVRVIAGERVPTDLRTLVRGAKASGQPDSVSAQRRRAVRPAAGAGPSMSPVAVTDVDHVCRMWTVSSPARQRGLAPGPARVW